MSAEEKIIARILEVLEALKVAGTVRRVEELTQPAALKGQRDAIFVLFGDEDNAQEEESLQGYVIEFTVTIIALVKSKTPAAKARQMKAAILRLMEADPQLPDATGRALCTKVTYRSASAFFEAGNDELGGCEINYLVQYHRQRGNPDLNF